MRRIWIGGAGLAAGLAASGVFALMRPDHALQTAAGMTAENLCAATFTQGLDPTEAFREQVKPMAGIAGPLLRYRVDRKQNLVTARLGLFIQARASWTPGYGCRLLIDPRYRSPAPVQPDAPSPTDGFAPPGPVEPADPRLKIAMDRLFAEAPGRPPRFVKAVVVVKDGRVVAERYASGFGLATPMMSYSVAKSFTNALLGVLVRQGRLKLSDPAGAPEWAAENDPRRTITLNDLLRMQSGLDAAETGSGFDPASQMLYTKDDMAAFAARHPLKTPPGTTWAYTSANTLILDRAIGHAIGGGPAGVKAFAEDQLFKPLRMDGVTLEFDGAGTFSGSAHVFAPARAFARFGWMYLMDGVAPDGRRILPEGWVAYSRRSTLGSLYGAGFWTMDGPSEDARELNALGFPKDGFFASGDRGQRIYIVPSQRLIIARFGYTGWRNFDIRGDIAFMREVIAALKSPADPKR